MDPSAGRAFCDHQHAAGCWATHVSRVRHPLLRSVWNFLSLKRAGVDRLARRCVDSALVLDLGAGNGAYSHWFLGRRHATIVAIDWSMEALRRIAVSRREAILRLCADARFLPLRPEIFDACFSIDTLGHTGSITVVLDELLRVTREGAFLFLHCECSDPQRRWPDCWLIASLGADTIGAADGHNYLPNAAKFHTACAQRFEQVSFVNPAGVLGWLIGYPEKYHPAFVAAHQPVWATITSFFAFLKRLPVAGWLLRCVNAALNRLEIFIGLSGGGSSFAELRKPTRQQTP